MAWSNKVIMGEEVVGSDGEGNHQPRPEPGKMRTGRGGEATNTSGRLGPPQGPTTRVEAAMEVTPAREENGGR